LKISQKFEIKTRKNAIVEYLDKENKEERYSRVPRLKNKEERYSRVPRLSKQGRTL